MSKKTIESRQGYQDFIDLDDTTLLFARWSVPYPGVTLRIPLVQEVPKEKFCSLNDAYMTNKRAVLMLKYVYELADNWIEYWVSSFHANGPFLYPLKTLGNVWFSDVFRGYRNGKLA